MKTKITLLISAWMFIAFNSALAQHFIPGASDYYELGLLFSQYSYKGSSRIQSLGGTQISLGGDLSSALSNPAGLGFYNRSEFSFTPSLNIYNTESSYLGKLTDASKPKFNFDQFGIALHKNFNKEGDFGGTFGFSYSKVNEFHFDYEISGLNKNNDILDYYTNEANIQNVAPGQLTGISKKAYDAYLTSEFYDVYNNGTEAPFYARTFFTEYPDGDYPTDQHETIETYGSQNYFSVAYGVNLADKFYFGANINLATLNYELTKDYHEIYPDGSIVQESSKREELRTKGTGAGLTIGAIYRPIPFVTLGASLMTPTWYSMSEEYISQVTANYNDFDMQNYGQYFNEHEEAISPNNPPSDYQYTYTNYDSDVYLSNMASNDDPNLFDYNLTTPMRLNGGATFFISKYGFISADVEWVDYSKIRFGSDGDAMDDQDDLAKSTYKDVVNVKIGGEVRLNNFNVRAGYGFYPSPYSSDFSDKQTNKFSLGFGYRNSKMFIDAATIYSSNSATYSPYSFPSDDESDIHTTPVANIDYSDLNINFTVGFFFQ